MSEAHRPNPPQFPVKVRMGTLELDVYVEGSRIKRGSATIPLSPHEEEWLLGEFERVRNLVPGYVPRQVGGPP